MTISDKAHDRITELELVAMIDACSDCNCPPNLPCFCASNLGWAERKLEEIRLRKALKSE